MAEALEVRAGTCGGHRIESASLSDVGRSRDENQDACAEFEDREGNRLLVVADGMGGHQGGATASRICVETVGRVFGSESGPILERMQRGLREANVRIHAAADGDPSLEGMGTTAVALAFTPHGEAFIAWVGDSRAYRHRAGQLEQLTEDHSLVAEWVRMGVLTAEQARTHPRKNELLRSIGVRPTVDVDVRQLDVCPGDRFLLCSDGLCGEVPAPDIASVLSSEAPEEAVRRLVEEANRFGGPDNITAQVAAVGAHPPAPEAERRTCGDERQRRPLALLAVGAAVGVLVLAGLGWVAVRWSGGTRPAVSRPEPGRALPRAEPAPELRPEQALPPPPPLREAEPASPDPVSPEPEAAWSPPPPAVPAPPRTPEASPAPGVRPQPAGTPSPPPAAPPPEAPPPEGEAAGTAPDVPAAASLPSPLVIPAAPEPLIERFLGDWARSAMTNDFDLYRSLGLELSAEEFARAYGERTGVLLRFELLDYTRPDDGTLHLRLLATYAYDDRGLSRRFEQERRIRVRATPEGLRYAGALE